MEAWFIEKFGVPSHRFTIPGHQYGFVSGNAKWNNRTKGPRSWGTTVRAIAYAAGFPQSGNIHATADAPVFIYTSSYFRTKSHPDPENVHKLIKDCLFYESRNGDKYTGGAYEVPQYDDVNQRTEVSIWFL